MTSDILQKIPEGIERMKALEALNAKWRASTTPQERWTVLRSTYSIMLPLLLQRRASPYFLDWAYHMTPIEQLAWMDIRSNGLPLYPQVPALHYFLDFADPVRQIAVELDGAAFHDRTRDIIRDTALYGQGWRVFRIPGKRSLPSNTDLAELLQSCQNQTDAVGVVSDWGCRWSEGFFWALSHWYYRGTRLAGLTAESCREAALRILLHHQLVEFEIDSEDE